MSPVFIFKNIPPILLLSVELQLATEAGTGGRGLYLRASRDARVGFPGRLRNVFHQESSGAKYANCVIFGNSDLALFR